MVNPSKVAAVATAAVLAMTPTAALAAKPHHRSAAGTCAALKKKEGVKRFDARFGTGKKHTGAMKRCIRMHTKTTSKKEKKS
jgi:hypothetical protein